MSPSVLAAAPPLLCPRCEAGIQPAALQLIEGGGTRHCFGRHDLGRRSTWLGVGVGVGVGGIGVSVGVGARGGARSHAWMQEKDICTTGRSVLLALSALSSWCRACLGLGVGLGVEG